MAMKSLKPKVGSAQPSEYAKHDSVVAPVPADNMPPNYYLESNRPYAEQAGQLFAERTARMMQDSLGADKTVSPEAMQMYAKSGVDHYMAQWHKDGRDIGREIREDVIRIGGHAREDMIDSRMEKYPDVLKQRGKDDMLGLCEQGMFKQNVGSQVENLRGMSVPFRAAAVSELRAKNGQNISPMMLQTMWNMETSNRAADVTHQAGVSSRKLPSMGEDLIAQQQASVSADYGDFGN